MYYYKHIWYFSQECCSILPYSDEQTRHFIYISTAGRRVSPSKGVETAASTRLPSVRITGHRTRQSIGWLSGGSRKSGSICRVLLSPSRVSPWYTRIDTVTRSVRTWFDEMPAFDYSRKLTESSTTAVLQYSRSCSPSRRRFSRPIAAPCSQHRKTPCRQTRCLR